MDEPPPAPRPGWYADPSGKFARRWWDGARWTEHTGGEMPPPNPAARVPPADEVSAVSPPVVPPPAVPPPAVPPPAVPPPVAPPQSSWTGEPARAAAPWGAYEQIATPPPTVPGAYVAGQPAIAGSGMRRIPALFSDVGRIILRAGWQILVISLAIWALWLALCALAAVALVDFRALGEALQAWTRASNEYPAGNYPESVSQDLSARFSEVPANLPVAVWLLVGVVAALVSLYTTTFQLAAVSRLAMDASAGQPVRWGAAVRSGLLGGVRLAGYVLLLSAIALLLGTALVGAAALLEPSAGGIATFIGVCGVLTFVVLSTWITGRLLPMSAQVVVSSSALSWSWRATRGKWFAVVGRYLVWSIVFGMITGVILTIVSIPFGLVAAFVAAANAEQPELAIQSLIGVYALLIPLNMAVSGMTMAGVVPIWRDLTDDDRYRSIDAQGRPVDTQ